MSGKLPIRPREVLLLLVCGLVLAWQLLLPGFIGLANNGDFGKVAGRVCIGGDDNGADNFVYFKAHYQRAERHCWNSGMPSSEIAIASIGSTVERVFSDVDHFDIRWLGAVHVLLFLAGWYTWLVVFRAVSGPAWWIVAIPALWMITDVATVSYLNTFYTDTSALLGAMAMIPAAVLLLQRKPYASLWFGAAALLFVTSKAQHAILAPLLALFLILAVRSASSFAIAAMLMIGMVWMLATTPDVYKQQNRFSVIFYKILPASPNAKGELATLGLAPDDARYIGMHAFLPGSPTGDFDWSRAFAKRGGYSQVAWFWLRHPRRTLGVLYRDLAEAGPHRRSINLSNFDRESGHAPGAQTTRFSSWSTLRSRLFEAWPSHIAVWYALILAFGVRFRTNAIAQALLFTAFLALAELGVASLSDAVDTFRHLLLFHVLTDFTLVLALVWAALKYSQRSLRLA